MSIWTVRLILSMALLSSLFLLTSCESEITHKEPVEDNPRQEALPLTDPDNLKIPVIESEKVDKVYGWLDNETILYSVQQSNRKEAVIKTWKMTEKAGEEFHYPAEQIIDVSISPDQSFVLVHTASTADTASLVILTHTGDVQYSFSIPSVELTYEWNIYEPGTLFLSGFNRDWSYTSYIVNGGKKSLETVKAPQPFLQWGSKDEIWYLDWNEEQPNLTAPLFKQNLEDAQKKGIMLDIIYFKKMKHSYFVIRDESETFSKATYTFYNEKNKSLAAFKIPHLKNFSDWLIPYYDYNETKQTLLTFAPDKAGNVDQYTGSFSLLSFNWKTGTQEKEMTQLENEPLSCSQNQDWCLYGYQFENIIDMNGKEVYPLFKQ